MFWLFNYLHDYLTGYCVEITIRPFVSGPFIVLASLALLAGFDIDTFLATLWWIFVFSPLWAPLMAVPTFWYWWMNYVRSQFLAKQKNSVLEIKLPKNMKQTPKAMERVFTSFSIRSGQTTWFTRVWKGGVGTYWSFELHSYEGKLRFYIWCRTNFVPLVKQFVYAQYPDVQIEEVQDYLSGLRYLPGKMGVWAVEHGKMVEPDALPIKTYVDYKLDKLDSGRNQEKYSDPLASVFERFADIRKGEQGILQIVVAQTRMSDAPRKWDWLRDGKRKKFKNAVKKLIKSYYEKARLDYDNIVTGEVDKGFAQLKPGEREVVDALERVVDKPGFEVNIRVARFGRPGEYRPALNSQHFTQMWRQFTAGKFNQLNTLTLYWTEHFDYIWQDFWEIRQKIARYKIFDCLRRRGGFYDPFIHLIHFMSAEELATIYHFPDANCSVPGIQYLASRTSEPPKNLPV